MIITTVEHFENGKHYFTSEEDFVDFTNKIFVENEDWMEMEYPKTYLDCVNYINNYCDNFKVL